MQKQGTTGAATHERAGTRASQNQQQPQNRTGAMNKGQNTATGQGTTGAATQRQQGAQTPQAQSQQNRTGAATQSPSTTTGQSTTGASTQTQQQTGTATQTQTQTSRTQLNAQQQTTIRQSVLSARNAPRVNVNSINFAINRGVVVPASFAVASVSAFPALVDVFPDFRDDSFFVVEDEVVILDRDRRVVDVVPVGPRTHFSSTFRGGGVATLNLNTDEIREVQQVLIDRGLLTGEADGVFGPRTREALITFQRQQGFQATGSIDTRTVSALGLSDRMSATRGQSSTSTIGQGQAGASTSSQQSTTGQGTGQANAPASQNPSATTGQAAGQRGTQQPPAQQQPAQQNTTGQAAPQNQSTVGQSGNQPSANQNMQSGPSTQGNAAGTSGHGNMQTPPENSAQNPTGK